MKTTPDNQNLSQPARIGFTRFFTLALLAIFLLTSSGVRAADSSAAPTFIWELGAPWPAGVTLHAAGDGYGYGPGPTHRNKDLYALDFNGWPNEEDPPVETNDKDLLVLSLADGCVRKVWNDKGYYDTNGNWHGNYGWNAVISHVGGYQVRYAHFANVLIPLMSYNPNSCYFISQGAPIGQIGGTGTEGNAAIHLHLAMYYCDPSKKNCTVQSVKPEPMEGISPLDDPNNSVDRKKITSTSFSVGYEAIEGEALRNPAKLKFHKPILDEYKSLGGQRELFGRASSPVRLLQGTSYYYQEFSSRPRVSSFSTTILQTGNRAFTIPGPIWEAYTQDPDGYGPPVASFYLTRQMDADQGWRADFSKASLFWNWGMSNPVVWDEGNAPWRASFCPAANNFDCTPTNRRDPYIDFEFLDSNNTGILRNSQGFSTTWRAKFDEHLVSKISLEYKVQGHALFSIDTKPQGSWIVSEDGIIEGVTEPTWHVGENTFIIHFWQAAGKPARLSLKVHESGLVESVSAFESQGTLQSFAYLPPPPGQYPDFEPPLYPGEADTPPVPPPGEPPVEPPIIPPDLEGWWQAFIKDLQARLAAWLEDLADELAQGLEQWWQENQERLLAELQRLLTQMLIDFVKSLEQQCAGGYAVLGGMGAGLLILKRRRHRP